MTYQLTLKMPDELRQPLTDVASSAGKTPEEWIVTVLRQQLPQRDLRLRRHFGSVDLGHPTGVSNAEIDADLARSYADAHEAA